MNRRRFLAAVVAGTPFLAGCTEISTNAESQNQTSTEAQSLSASLDSSKLTTYSNQRYSYSVRYPAGWNVHQKSPPALPKRRSDPAVITFAPSPSSNTAMFVHAYPGPVSSKPLNRIVPPFLNRFKKKLNKFSILHRRGVTLPNGTAGKVIDVTYKSSVPTVKERGKFVFTLNGRTFYEGLISVPEKSHTQKIDQSMNTIVESLTVSSAIQPQTPVF